jgi:hypothetical protein
MEERYSNMIPMQSNLTVSFKAPKRTYAEKMLRKYEHVLQKRIRDKRIHLGRKRKDWTIGV